MRDPVLCYVAPESPWCYFTTKDLSEQWGDDWNDAPYEHNAGPPYGPCWHNEPEHVAKRGGLCTCVPCVRDWHPDGTPKWEIVQVAIDAPLVTPDEGFFNSPYSVEAINAGAIPWLRTDQYHQGESVSIPAGTTLIDFCELVRRASGTVYLATEFPQGMRGPIVAPTGV
jgi:hypothetical protein